MADNRTRRQKLEAMARQTASPHEAEVARRKLDAMGPEPVRSHPRERNTYRDTYDMFEFIRRNYSWSPPPPSEAEIKRKGTEALAETLRSKGIFVPYGEGDASAAWASEGAKWNRATRARTRE